MLNAKRLVAALLIVGIAMCVSAGAQADDADRKLIRGKMDNFTLHELITLYTNESGRTVIFNPRQVSGDVSFNSPLKGAGTTSEQMLLAALAESRLTLVNAGEFERIAPMTEAMTSVPLVTIDELDNLASLRFVRIVYHLNHTEPGAARNALQNLMTRQGGYIGSIAGSKGAAGVSALVICDTVENLKEMVAVLKALDKTPATVSRVMVLQHVKASDIHGAVASASGSAVAVGVPASDTRIVLTGSPSDVERVASVITALDAK